MRSVTPIVARAMATTAEAATAHLFRSTSFCVLYQTVSGRAASGYFVSGAQSYTKFRKLIDRALAEAK